MNNSPYLDLPLFSLADALKAGVRTLCATKGSTSNLAPTAMPNPADNAAYPLAPRQADEARADFVAIESDLQFIMGQLAGQPSRAWLARMWLLGFGSVWALIAALMLAR